MKRILFFFLMLATFASAQTDSTDILITVREDGDTTAVGRWRAGMPVLIRDSWNKWGEREKQGNKFVIIRVGIAKSRIDSFLVNHSDSTTGLRRKYQLSRAAIQFVKNNRDANNVVRVTPAQLRNAFKRANRLRRFGEPQRMSIIPDRLYIRWRNMLIGATPTTATVNTDGGGDYTSLAAAEAGEQKDLETANEQLTISCSGTTADVTAVVFDGWTTDATRNIVVQGDNVTGIWQDINYRLLIGNYVNAILVSMPNVVFANLQLQGATLSYSGINATAKTTVINCIVKNFDATNQNGIVLNTHQNSVVINNIFYNCSRGIFINNVGSHYIYSNTIYNCDQQGIITNYAGNNVLYYNNLVVDCGTAYLKINPSETTNGNNNLSSDATMFGSSGYINQTVNFADAANGDFRLLAGSPGIDQGVNLSSDPNFPFNTDIVGTTRPQESAWDIGAFEYVQPATTNNDKKSRYKGFGTGFKGGWKK